MKQIILKQDNLLSKYGCLQFVTPDVEDIDYIISQMLLFLENIFPELQPQNKKELLKLDTTNTNIISPSQKICIEIRPLMRRIPLPEAHVSSDNRLYIKNPSFKSENFRLFSFSDKQKHSFSTYIKRLLKKNAYFCLYYSVYNFDHSIITTNKKGEKYPIYKNMISHENSFSTQRLVCDFDDITEHDFLIVYERLVNIGLEPSITILSGHGYQCIFKLDKPSGDLTLLTKYTDYLLNMSFPVDRHIRDSARIMRMPFSWNCKEFGKKELVYNNEANAIYTYIYKQSNSIYSLDDINKRLTSQTSKPIVSKHPTKITKSTCTVTEFECYEISPFLKTISTNYYAYNFLKSTYPMLFLDGIEDTVKKMLLGFQKKTANNVLLFLVSYFKEKGYSLEVICNVIDILKDLDTFSYSWDDLDVEHTVKRIYYNYCDVSAFFLYEKNELSAFGPFELQGNIENLNIYNFILDALAYYKPTGLYIYMTILYWNNLTLQSNFTLTDISSLTALSTRTLYRNLKPFVRKSDIKYQNYFLLDKSVKDKCFYKSIIHSSFEIQGFFTIKYDAMDTLLELVKSKTICSTTFSIALILKKYSFGTQSTYITQSEIAKILGFKTQATISRELHHLEDLGLILIKTKPISKFQVKNEYFLKY